MILAPLSDPILRATVRRAALPEEDVFVHADDVQEAVRFGFPRLFIHSAEDRLGPMDFLPASDPRIPILTLTRPTLKSWEVARRQGGFAVSRIDDSALRLRSIMRTTAEAVPWVEGTFIRLGRIVGRALPMEFRGFARRILEFPWRYGQLEAVAEVTGISPGALKARFRRRGLCSPSRYLRWFRVMAAGQVLSDPMETTLTASYRLGFTSDGNFCRWIQSTTGLSPSRLRTTDGRTGALLAFAGECLDEGRVEAWESLDGLFLREVA